MRLRAAVLPIALLVALIAGCMSSQQPRQAAPSASEPAGFNDPVLPLSPTLNQFVKPEVTELSWYDKPDSSEWTVVPAECQLVGEAGYADQWGQSWTKFHRLVLADAKSARPPFVDTVSEVWVEEIMVQYSGEAAARSAYNGMTSNFSRCDNRMLSSKSKLGTVTPWLSKVYELTETKARWENLQGGSTYWGCASEARLSGYAIVSATICSRDPKRGETVGRIADLMGDIRA
ncbi:MAG: sensor domain-containing protein [Segniliparus sp.]|uniref:sensor domain-containing protein n=1 Tax=Segniliparus sp. TaxID=2804064 RepID=UPI003F2B8AC4